MTLPMLYAIVTATLCLVLAWLLTPRIRGKSGKSTGPITVSRIYVHPIKVRTSSDAGYPSAK
jgi:hypothetical protein